MAHKKYAMIVSGQKNKIGRIIEYDDLKVAKTKRDSLLNSGLKVSRIAKVPKYFR